MPHIELYSFPEDARLVPLKVAAKYADVEVRLPSFEVEKDSATVAYALNCDPLGRVPVAKVDEGYLFETHAIARYLARQDANLALYGGTGAYEQSQVDAWLDLVSTEMTPAVKLLIGAELGYLAKGTNSTQTETAMKTLKTVFSSLNQQLETRTFLVGERVTIADLVLGGALEEFFRICKSKPLKEGHVHLLRYVDTVINQLHFASVLQESPKVTVAKKEAKVEKKAEKKPEAKKAEKAKKSKEADDEDAPPGFEDDNNEEKLKMKAMKAALDTLPPSPTFIMDEFKRCYSNNDTRTIAAPFFFEKYDPSGYTCLWSKYKYNDELSKMVFMTSNLVGGMFQRMDALHKYVFGTVLIIGEEAQQEIVGFWVVRGKGMPELMKIVDDVEHHEWEEVQDLLSMRERITDYLSCEGPTFATKPVLDYKIFK